MKTCRNLVENYIIRRKEQLITVAKYEPCHEQTTVRLCETKGADQLLVRHEYGIFSMDLEVGYKVFFLDGFL